RSLRLRKCPSQSRPQRREPRSDPPEYFDPDLEKRKACRESGRKKTETTKRLKTSSRVREKIKSQESSELRQGCEGAWRAHIFGAQKRLVKRAKKAVNKLGRPTTISWALDTPTLQPVAEISLLAARDY